ncbi:MAG TPA: RIP metalloprotease RseP [Gallionellaceae bacterium]
MITTDLWAFAVTIGVLVVFHELGHYWVARLCGVKVLRFSVGFGKVLFSWHFGKGETEWALSVIPLGGYVKMLDEREGEVAPHELARAFNRKPVWQRMAIVVAGPAFNLLLAVILYFMLFTHGVDGTRAVLGEIPAKTPAAEAQLQKGETVLSVNGDAMQSWEEVRWRLLMLGLQRGKVEITGQTADGVTRQHVLDLGQIEPSDLERDFMQKLGLQPNYPPIPAVVGEVVSGSAAEHAGLRTGDRVLRVDGKEIATFDQWAEVVRAHPETLLHLDIVRDGHEMPLDITPKRETEEGKVIGRVGVAPDLKTYEALVVPLQVKVSYAPIAALGQAAQKTWDISSLSLQMMGRMALGQVSLKSMSGPVKTATYAGKSAKMGLIAFIFFLAAISVGVGVLNILPIPVLDGGHLLYYMAEFFMGRPVQESAWETGQKIGVALLSALMILVLYNDISSLISG